MNVAYIVHYGEFSSGIATMLASLDRHCTCRLIIVSPDLTDLLQKQISAVFTQPIEFRPICSAQWVGQRMARKIWELQNISFVRGEKVFVLDTDLIIQANIFEAFNGDFDVALTSRHYDYWYKINAGVWCFEYNDNSRRFLQFFAHQIRKPTWRPFIEFQEHFEGRRPVMPLKNLDWWCDQDFLCAVYGHKLPFACTIRDLGSSYNFCPSVEDDVPGTFERAGDEILAKLDDPDIKVLHFKGRLKQVLTELPMRELDKA